MKWLISYVACQVVRGLSFGMFKLTVTLWICDAVALINEFFIVHLEPFGSTSLTKCFSSSTVYS